MICTHENRNHHLGGGIIVCFECLLKLIKCGSEWSTDTVETKCLGCGKPMQVAKELEGYVRCNKCPITY